MSPILKLGVGGLEVTAGTPKGTAGDISVVVIVPGAILLAATVLGAI
jgi:hypothetical protein